MGTHAEDLRFLGVILTHTHIYRGGTGAVPGEATFGPEVKTQLKGYLARLGPCPVQFEDTLFRAASEKLKGQHPCWGSPIFDTYPCLNRCRLNNIVLSGFHGRGPGSAGLCAFCITLALDFLEAINSSFRVSLPSLFLSMKSNLGQTHLIHCNKCQLLAV